VKGDVVRTNVLYSNELATAFPSVDGAAARTFKIFAFIAFTAAGAQLSVRLPFTPVPITLQTLFVVLAGLTLGPRDGFLAMLAYLGAGFAGAPVFAEFSFGPWALLGPTGGYLIAFPAAALISGVTARRLGRNRRALTLSALAGSGLILVIGASYLALLSGVSPGGAVLLGIAPFAAGELVKSIAAAFIAAR
jgi:biotin transport system substrate-specific component